MAKKQFIVPACLMAMSALCLWQALAHPPLTVRLTRQEVQGRVDARLPMSGVKDGVTYEISRAVVDLRPDGRVGIDAEVGASTPGRNADVRLTATGPVTYADGILAMTGLAVEKATPGAIDPALATDEAPKGRIASAIDALGIQDRATRTLQATGAEAGAAFLTADRQAAAGMVRDKGSAMLVHVLDRSDLRRVTVAEANRPVGGLAIRRVAAADGALEVDLNDMATGTRYFLFLITGLLALTAVAAGVLAGIAAIGRTAVGHPVAGTGGSGGATDGTLG